MEESITLQQNENLVCENCQNSVPNNLKFCSSCSFPVGGSETEKSTFRSDMGIRRRMLKQAEEKVKTAKIIIYVLAGLTFIMAMINGFVNDDFVTMIVNLTLSLLYLILAAWSDKNSFGAILTTFIIYITLIVINFFFEPSTLLSGIWMKIFMIAAFVKGIRSAKEAQDLFAELEKTKSVSA
jgi:hypothetical protein